MATRTWTGMVSSDWNNPLNWNPPMVPMSGDDVVLPAAASDYMVGLASTTPALDSLTIGAAGGAGAIELDITGGATLDVTGSGAGATDTITLAEGGNTSIKPTSGSTIKAANLVFANSNGRVVGAGALAISGNISGPGLLE